MLFQIGPDPNHFIEVDEMTPPGVLPRVGIIYPKYDSEEDRQACWEAKVRRVQEICRNAVLDPELVKNYKPER